MKICIAEDEIWSRRNLARMLKQCRPAAEIVSCSSGSEVLEKAAADHFDAFFLDIRLGDLSGVVLAGALQKMSCGPVVFVTAYGEYALQAYDLNVIDYLTKPLSEARLKQALQKVEQQQRPMELVLHQGRAESIIALQQIVYIESHGRKCLIVTEHRHYEVTGVLAKYEQQYSWYFLRVHKSYLAARRAILAVVPWLGRQYGLRLKGISEMIPVSRRRVGEIKQKLGSY